MPIRKIPKNYRNVTGIASSTKANGLAAFESTLERDFLSLLEFDSKITNYEVQPMIIPWKDNQGKLHQYTPDALVIYDSKKFNAILYEVKYRKDLKENWHILKPKFKAAISFCKTKDWKFKIITEKEIKTSYLENIKFLLPYISKATLHEYYEEYMTVLDLKLKDLKESTPKQLINAIFQDEWTQAQALPILWYLIATFHIKVNLNEPLTMNSKIWYQHGSNTEN